MKTNYRNRLPHIAPVGATFFLTFRLADSLPQSMVQRLKTELENELKQIKTNFPGSKKHEKDARKRYFGKFDHQLDNHPYGICHLKHPEVANILMRKLHEYHQKLYDLHAYCIMPNHVHILINMATQWADKEGNWSDIIPEHYVPLDKVMQLIKGGSAFSIHKYLGKTGKLWFKDSYDHYVRTEAEWLNITRYILQNPVKAGLASRWEDWPYRYCRPDLLDKLYTFRLL